MRPLPSKDIIMQRAAAVVSAVAVSVLGLGAASASASEQTLGPALAPFAVLGGMSVVNTGPTVVTGDLGVSPGTLVAGFPPGIVIGTSHQNDAGAIAAQSALASAYNTATALPCRLNLTGQDLGGLTLTPGVYCFNAGAQLNGTLTLDHQGDPNASFVFQVGTTLTTATGSNVEVVNAPGETCAPNATWAIGSSATLGANTTFAGDLLAFTSVTLNSGTTLTGRALAANGAVALGVSNVSPCPAPPAADLSVDATGAPDPVAPGDAVTYAITATNDGPDDAADAELDATLPSGLDFASLDAPAGWTCTTPAVGDAGAVSCTSASAAVGAAPFTLAATADAGITADETVSVPITLSSATSDPDDADLTTSVDTRIDAPDPVVAPDPIVTDPVATAQVVTPPVVPPAAAPTPAPPAPAPTSCQSVRRFTVHLSAQPHAVRGVSVVKANVVSASGRRLRKMLVTLTTVKVDLRGLPKGTVTLRITTRLRSGKTAVVSRSYTTCGTPAR
jgi:uncharacterized repeat protein (TIGR01451 family)